MLRNAALVAPDAACVERLYRGRDYVPVRHVRRMLVELETPPRLPALAAAGGISLEPFDPARDARAVHAALEEAFTDHWDHVPRAWPEWRRRVLTGERYDPGLWFVARDGDQLVGAVSTAWKAEGDWGYVDALGVRGPWRRRGIGEALLLRAFAALWERGERRVALDVDAESESGALRLYEQAGMRVLWRAVVYEKALTAIA
ncbi:MAG: GNAT family N-acetyltransferase [Actinobacteria bacterium]|nr:GNAT family N-acetyltransferase [Actinomycetota bacterium]